MAEPDIVDPGDSNPDLRSREGSRADLPLSDPPTPRGVDPAATRSDALTASARRTDRSPWNWLLLIPIIVPLVTTLYNAKDPAVLGFPRFYWLQLAFVLLGVLVTTLVYQVTRDRS